MKLQRCMVVWNMNKMNETRQYLKHFSQIVEMQIEDYENGSSIDEVNINKIIDKLKYLIRYRK